MKQKRGMPGVEDCNFNIGRSKKANVTEMMKNKDLRVVDIWGKGICLGRGSNQFKK